MRQRGQSFPRPADERDPSVYTMIRHFATLSDQSPITAGPDTAIDSFALSGECFSCDVRCRVVTPGERFELSAIDWVDPQLDLGQLEDHSSVLAERHVFLTQVERKALRFFC